MLAGLGKSDPRSSMLYLPLLGDPPPRPISFKSSSSPLHHLIWWIGRLDSPPWLLLESTMVHRGNKVDGLFELNKVNKMTSQTAGWSLKETKRQQTRQAVKQNK